MQKITQILHFDNMVLKILLETVGNAYEEENGMMIHTLFPRNANNIHKKVEHLIKLRLMC